MYEWANYWEYSDKQKEGFTTSVFDPVQTTDEEQWKLKMDAFLKSATVSTSFRAQWLIILEIPVLVRSLKSSNVELG